VLQLQKEVGDLIRIDQQNKKNKVSFDELEKMQPQRCPSCSNPLGPDGNSQHYKNMQMQFLDRPMQAKNAGSAINNLLQVEVGKPKAYKQVYHTEKRSATNKKRGGTVGGFNASALNASTPEKSNSQIKGLLNALNVSQSATSKGKSSVGNSRNKMKAAGALGANTVCGCGCPQASASCRKKGHRNNYLTGGNENPYFQGASFFKSNEQNANNKSMNVINEQSSNGSLQ